MEPLSSPSNLNMLKSLKQKQLEIIKEVEILENKVTYINNKKNISEKICSELKNSSDSIKSLLSVSNFPHKSVNILQEVSWTIQEQSKIISKHLNFDLESLAIPKLFKLTKLQASINTFTEEFYLDKMKELESLVEQSKNLTQSKLHKSGSNDRAAELAQSLELIQVQNSQFVQAIKKNIDQLSVLIEPAVEKALNLLVVLEHSPTHKETEDFFAERVDLEDKFRDINNYIQVFSKLFQEFINPSGYFDTFSEISNNDSIHQLELEELENKHHFSLDKSKHSKDQTIDLKIIDEIVKIVDIDAENQKIHLKSLLKIMESLNTENKKWESQAKCTQKSSSTDQIKFVFSIISDFFQLLKDSIQTKDQSISRLERVREKAQDHKKHIRLSSSIFEDHKHSYIFIDPPEIPSGISIKRYQEDKTCSKFNETSPFTYAENLVTENEVSLPYKLEKDSLENNDKASEDLRTSQSQNRIFQSTILNLQQKDQKNCEIIQNMQKKSREFKVKSTQVLKNFHQDLTLLKTNVNEEFLRFCSYIKQRFYELERKMNYSRMSSLSSVNKELEELKYLNEAMELEKEALKDSFQGEIRKCMAEQQELKKLNKDLKDSLLKLSTKYETQNKLTSEIMSLVNHPGDTIQTFKLTWQLQQKFIARIQSFFNEKDLEMLSLKILNRDVDSSDSNQKYLALIEEVYKNYENNIGKIMNVLSNFIEKYLLKLEKCKQLFEIFKKIYINGMHGGMLEVESLGGFSNGVNERIEELERSVIKYKHSERELQCIISTKTLELQESIENFNTLGEFTENCIRVIQEFQNLCSGKEEFNQILPAIKEILELSEKYYNN